MQRNLFYDDALAEMLDKIETGQAKAAEVTHIEVRSYC